jgi:hypothetical protein
MSPLDLLALIDELASIDEVENLEIAVDPFLS